ncbi:MAG: DUF819 family protein, partial [Bacteroidetes bacterium]
MVAHFSSLAFVLGVTLFVAYTAERGGAFFEKLYRWVPSILLLYLLPALAVNVGVLRADASVRLLAMDTALPLCLIVLTAVIHLPDLLKISRPGLLTFLAGTLGIVVGGPLALALAGLFEPDLLAERGADSVWRGLICITGGWINGTPGQLSMKEVYGSSEPLFLSALAADIILQNLWLVFLLYSAKFQHHFNRLLLGADAPPGVSSAPPTPKENGGGGGWPSVKEWGVAGLTLG